MFETMIAALVAREIRFVVVGGVAATVQGSSRFTNDLDICYEPAARNVARLLELLKEWKAYLRGVEADLPFILDERTFRTTPLMTLSTSEGALDLLDAVPGIGDFAAVVEQSEKVRIGATEFRSLTLEALIKSKQALRRKKDVEQIIELEAILALRKRGQTKK